MIHKTKFFKSILFILILLTNSISMAFAAEQTSSIKSKKETTHCGKIEPSRNQLKKWISLALKNNSSIGCPSFTNDSPLATLEIISQQQDNCGEEAKGILLAFYSIFSKHPNYKMCGLLEKEEVFLAQSAIDGMICNDQNTDKIRACFSNVDIVISQLKIRGETKAAFELAKKTANSGDVTGLSQMILAFLYQYGNGTEKDLSMTIKWQKEALVRIEDHSQRINCMISLSSAYEDKEDYENAKIYSRQCASMGDLDCKKGYIRLNTNPKTQ